VLMEYGLGRPAVLPESAWAPDPDPDTQQQAAQVDAAVVFDRENPALSNERRISLLAYGNPELVTCPKCGGPGAFTQPPED
jgi:hypothetical protein